MKNINNLIVIYIKERRKEFEKKRKIIPCQNIFENRIKRM